MKLKKEFRRKTLIVFDLDGTLTESKSVMTRDVGTLLQELLKEKMVAVIGGGRYQQFKDQFLSVLRIPPALRARLFLFPTTSTSFYRYRGGAWRRIYEERFTKTQKRKIMNAFHKAFRDVRYEHPPKVYGEVIEDRGTQITFSALGQDIVARLGKRGIRMKEAWGKSGWREKIARSLKKYLPEFEVRRGGLTSIDVTRKGIDKAYGIRQIEVHLKIPRRDMLFVGDAIYPGGNDYAALKTGVDYVKVSGPKETKKLIRNLLQ